MHFLLVAAYPDLESYSAELQRRVSRALCSQGHSVDLCDLYREQFQPVLGVEEKRAYGAAGAPHEGVESYIRRLRKADGVIFVFPTWYYGMPAILKGYFDRVWLPGVAFDIVRGHPKPLLGHIRRFAVVTTYGQSRWMSATVVGEPNRKVFMRGLRRLIAPNAVSLWLACYGMDSNQRAERAVFLAEVEAAISRLGDDV